MYYHNYAMRSAFIPRSRNSLICMKICSRRWKRAPGFQFCLIGAAIISTRTIWRLRCSMAIMTVWILGLPGSVRLRTRRCPFFWNCSGIIWMNIRTYFDPQFISVIFCRAQNFLKKICKNFPYLKKNLFLLHEKA